MKLSRVHFRESQSINRVGTQSVLTAESGWDIEVTPLGLICRRQHPDGEIVHWTPLEAARGGTPVEAKKVDQSAFPTAYDLARMTPEDAEMPMAQANGFRASECPDCDFKTNHPAALASHRRNKHPEAA